jgi:hypothetical protein
MGKNSFANSMTTYKDTFGKGAISVRGFNLETDEDGFIEGPPDIAADIAPHGFLPMPRPEKKTLGVPTRK